jgi:hypothetical protein
VAVHETGVTPGWNTAPAAGSHVVWTGSFPPDVVGADHVIVMAWFWTETPDGADGHVTASAGGVGVVGESGHPAADTDSATVSSHGAVTRLRHISVILVQRFRPGQSGA